MDKKAIKHLATMTALSLSLGATLSAYAEENDMEALPSIEIHLENLPQVPAVVPAPVAKVTKRPLDVVQKAEAPKPVQAPKPSLLEHKPVEKPLEKTAAKPAEKPVVRTKPLPSIEGLPWLKDKKKETVATTQAPVTTEKKAVVGEPTPVTAVAHKPEAAVAKPASTPQTAPSQIAAPAIPPVQEAKPLASSSPSTTAKPQTAVAPATPATTTAAPATASSPSIVKTLFDWIPFVGKSDSEKDLSTPSKEINAADNAPKPVVIHKPAEPAVASSPAPVVSLSPAKETKTPTATEAKPMPAVAPIAAQAKAQAQASAPAKTPAPIATPTAAVTATPAPAAMEKKPATPSSAPIALSAAKPVTQAAPVKSTAVVAAPVVATAATSIAPVEAAKPKAEQAPAAPLKKEEKQQIASITPAPSVTAPVKKPVTTALPAQTPVPAASQATIKLAFGREQTELSSREAAKLSGMIKQAKTEKDQRLKVVSYASAASDQPSAARRVSLQRAIAVRKYLIDQGVEANRINVQAMGENTSSHAKDYVDVLYMKEGKTLSLAQ